jgi:transaldolase/glucose-6-phosphate isomerase
MKSDAGKPSGSGRSEAAAIEIYQLGRYESGVRARLADWTAGRAADRIWKKDFTFWSPRRVPELTDRLGWLGLPETMEHRVDDLDSLTAEVQQESIQHVVLLAMGGSSLAPEVYQAVFGNRSGFPPLLVLDSTHPDAVGAIEGQIDPKNTLFIVASKSGTTVESLSFFRYFYHRLSNASDRPGSRFIAITDPGSPLEDLAAERGFRRVFRADPEVGGRYSALSHFGLVPAALIGIDAAGYLRRGRHMAARCRRSGDQDANPGLKLGAILGELWSAGRDKITLFTSRSLESFPKWLEQLIAESTGKDGKGLVPVVGEPLGKPEAYGEDRVFVYLCLSGEQDPDRDALLGQLASKGHPVLRFEIGEKAGLAGEMFRWEMGVAAAGAVLGIHPFNQPDVQRAKSFAKQAMSGEGRGPGSDVETIPADAGDELSRSVGRLFATVRARDYVGLQAFIAPTEACVEALDAIRARLRDRHRIAATTGFGPGFLHSTGQLHKGGPDSGIFLQLVDSPTRDMEVPETGFTFGRLISAQALGDYQALSEAGRRAIRIGLGQDPPEGLRRLRAAIEGEV